MNNNDFINCAFFIGTRNSDLIESLRLKFLIRKFIMNSSFHPFRDTVYTVNYNKLDRKR